MSTKNKLYAIYSRKSTDDAENQKNSIEYQVTSCLDFARRSNLSITSLTEEGFIEKGIIREKHSAYKTADLNISKDGSVQFDIERPKFQKLIKLLTTGVIDGVVCLCWDRVSRNDQDSMLIKALKKRGIEFQFVQVSYDDSSSGELHCDIDGVFSNHYSRVVSEKVRNTFEKFRADGRCIGPASIGYLDHGSDNKPIDPIRGPIVIRIFEMYATGEWSISQLAKWANQQGLTTKPSRPKRSRAEILAGVENDGLQISRPATAKTIENILKNPYYIGRHRNKQGETWACKHTSLISQQLFFKVQQVLKSKTTSIHYIDKPFFTYREAIRCECGRVYTPYLQKRWRYYRCSCKDGCNNTSINLKEDEVHTGISRLLGGMILTDEELRKVELKRTPYLAKIDEEKNTRLKDLERERNKIQEEATFLNDNKLHLLRSGVSTIEEFKAEQYKLEQRLEKNQEQINNVGESGDKMLNTVIQFSELIKMANLYYKNAPDPEKRDVVDVAFHELIYSNNDLRFNLIDGFLQVFSRVDKKKTHLDEQDVVSGSADGSRTHLSTTFEGSFYGVKPAPGSHQSETNGTIRQGVTPNENSGNKGVLTNSNMRTEDEQSRTFTDEEIGDFVRFFELLAQVDRRLKGWKERLKTEPEGFPINNGIYDCNLCCRSMRDYEGWYDQYGLKCLLCRKAVDEGIVPGSAVLDDKTWFSVTQLSTKYGWHHTTVHKKARSGELKARIVRNVDGKPYFYVFLKEENQLLNFD